MSSIRKIAAAAAAVAVAAACTTSGASAVPSFPSPPAVSVGDQIVAGLSSGAFMAVQYQVAYSSQLLGAGIIAGGPYYCAAGSLVTAETNCMSQPNNINVQASVQAAQSCAQDGKCDDLSNLAKHRVWLYSGTGDTVVDPGVMQKLQQSYASLGVPNSQVETKFDLDSEHCWPTTSYGSSCTTLGSPYISACNYDASLQLVSSVLNRTLSSGTASSSNYYQISQDSYVPSGTANAAAISMGPLAYLYVPAACAASGAKCLLVTAFHGCQQNVGTINLEFVQDTQLSDAAEANGFMVLYPQAIASYYPVENSSGCWDWFGYTTSDYANQNGPQMATVQNIIQALAKSGGAVSNN